MSKGLSRWTLAALLMAGAAMPAAAQGRGKGEEKKAEKAEKAMVKADDKRVATVVKADDKRDKAIIKANEKHDRDVAKAQRRVTPNQAVIVTRDVLQSNGYQVTQVVPSGTSQVIYYRRGNMGRGRGLGPIEKIVVVPSGQVVSFQSVPQPLLATILSRLGM